MELLTEQLSNELCEAVFSEEIKRALLITLPSGRTIPLYKQFHSHYRNRVLQYSKEDTITEMALIAEYSQQEIKKLQLYKSKLDTLNNPESYFLTRVSNVVNSDTNNNMNSENSTNNKSSKTLSLNRGDSENATINKSLVRTGNSAFNEDFAELESSWDKKDKNLEDSSKERNLLDINTDTLNSNNIDGVTVGTKIEEKRVLQESESESPTSEIAYTNVALNKSIVNNKTGTVNTSKNFNLVKDTNTLTKSSLSTGVSNKQLKSIQLEFTYNQATIEVFNNYITNFRESFFNSFSSLFVPYWRGYGQ